MGKMKSKTPKSMRPVKLSLADQIAETSSIKMKNRQKTRNRADEDEEFVDPKTSWRILKQAQRQQKEIEEETGLKPTSSRPQRSIIQLDTTINDDSDDDNGDNETKSLGEDDEFMGNEFFDNIPINEEDERALAMFMDHSREPALTLADIIMGKITEKKTEIETQFSEIGSIQLQEIDPRIKAMYEGVRDVLAKYRSGKLPKAFKIIPSLRNWEQILYITNPVGWSAAAMYQGTRIFASNLKENMAQRFYNLVLLPRIRDDIAEYKRLNVHLYHALRKALFKPGGFMKGIVLPLLKSGTCTLREAVIVGSVIAKNSIPVLHSAATMLKIAEMEYTGANSIFLRILFDKKYALPFRVVDGVVFHFLRFERDPRQMPVLWHQALLTFVQRYKNDLGSEQKEELLQLLKKQVHPILTPEIRREIQSAKCRDVESDASMEEPMKIVNME